MMRRSGTAASADEEHLSGALVRAGDSAGVVHLLAARWVLPVLARLASGGMRYQDLHDAAHGISYKVLTETLRRAERDGLIARHLDAERVETAMLYELTDLGRSLEQPLAALAAWAEVNWKAVEAAREQWDGRRQTGR